MHLHRCLYRLERNTSPGDCGLSKDKLHCSLDAQFSIRGIRLHRSSRSSVHVSPLVKTDIMRCSHQGAPSATGVLLITERGAQRYALFINVQHQRLMQSSCCSKSISPVERSILLTAKNYVFAYAARNSSGEDLYVFKYAPTKEPGSQPPDSTGSSER